MWSLHKICCCFLLKQTQRFEAATYTYTSSLGLGPNNVKRVHLLQRLRWDETQGRISLFLRLTTTSVTRTSRPTENQGEKTRSLCRARNEDSVQASHIPRHLNGTVTTTAHQNLRTRVCSPRGRVCFATLEEMAPMNQFTGLSSRSKNLA